ncbi:MAG: hypothetical protein KKB70_08605 [Proteobacteria bacterium]|nr:hypothetical protein [Pseudomonadota bacterium]MBU1611187.1 hypothetical protein [Pseudomonadota bacterium]
MPTACTRSPRVKMHKNGHVTISGLNYDDAKAILTAAVLYRRENPHVPEPQDPAHPEHDWMIVSNNAEDASWHRRQNWIIRALIDGIKARVQESHPVRSRSVSDRLAEIKDRVGLRNRIHALIEKARAVRVEQDQVEV